jgi:hypothetical protein
MHSARDENTRARRLVVAAAIALAGASSTTVVVSCSSSSTEGVNGADASSDAGEPQLDAVAETSLPDSAGTPCNPVKQDCADPSLKCSIVKVGQSNIAACAPSNGAPPAQDGDPCTRGPIGVDNCVKGTHCFPNGSSALLACRKTCATDSDCAAGAKCAGITQRAPYFGVCFPECTLFGAGCGGGTCSNAFDNNDRVNTFEGCRNVGAAGLGESCSAQWDCKADMSCFGSPFTCHLMCDATHACGDAGTCTSVTGLANGGGECK